PGFVIDGARFTGVKVSVKSARAWSAPSVTVTATANVPAALTVPPICPVEALIERPAGNPLALNVSASPSASAAEIGKLKAPVFALRSPGLVMVGAWLAGIPLTSFEGAL